MNSMIYRLFACLFLLAFSIWKVSGQCPDAPVTSNLSVYCNNTSTAYTVSFQITGGDPNSYVVTPMNGTLDMGVFTSNLIPTGTGYSFIVDDAFHCDPVTVQQTLVDCDCQSYAGDMSLVSIDVCGTEPVAAQFMGNESLDADDILLFILHTSPNSLPGSILSTNTTPIFAFEPTLMTYGTIYYISAVVGNNDGQGGIDYSDPCLSIAPGTPVTWHEAPTAIVPSSDITLCDGGNVQIAVILNGEAPWTLLYSINGVTQTPVTTSNNPAALNLSPTESAEICFLEISDQYCSSLIPNGCFDVIVNPPLVCSLITTNTCPGANDGSITLNCTGGTPPYSYLWSGPGSGPDWQNLAPGVYSINVIDAAGCSWENTVAITAPVAPLITVIASGNGTCGETTLFAQTFGGTPPFTFEWLAPTGETIGTSQAQVVSASGIYTVIITDANGCESAQNWAVTAGNASCGTINGHLTTELDGNCGLDPGENGLSGWMVRATATNGDEYFGITDNLGNYDFMAALGDYTVAAIPPANFWDDCTGPIALSLSDTADVDTADFHQFQVINCPLMEVDISAPLLRRCFDNTYYVNYCNNGTQTALDASVVVTLDPLLGFVGSTFPNTQSGNEITFPVGDLEPGECGTFNFTAQVSCDAVLGQTLCAEAHAYPDSICGPANVNWSGAFVEVTSTCTADSVIFTLTNTGTGDMDEPSYFIVVQDGVMLMTQDFELEAGESTTVSYPATGATYSLLAEQVSDAPGNSQPSLFVEGWSGNGSFSTGYALQFPENDVDPFISIDCQEVIGSYDPNDKRGYPLGFGENELIEEGQALDYHIRFQNTGTDTAFKVVIKDVIAPDLDIATLRPGASSHPYRLDIHQDTLLFIFENILLPDSNVNEPGSHGFVKFNIGQRAALPLGTVIENEAGIYFDFNDPVITNRTRHQIGEPFIINATEPLVLRSKISCTVYPNPMSEEAIVLIQGAENQQFELRLYDPMGRYLHSEKITGGMGKIRKNGLADGLYFYEITANGAVVGQGKVAVE